MFGLIADALYFAVDSLYIRAYEMLLNFWEEASSSFNHGQLAIYFTHLEPALHEWLNEAQNDWPWTDAGLYMDAMYASYDAEVLERAFSDTIVGPAAELDEIIYQAQILYELAQMFEAMDGLSSRF